MDGGGLAVEQPQQVEDEEYERAWERVAAIDVAKASGVVCTRVPDEDRPGRRKMHVWTVTATMGAVTELGDHLRCAGHSGGDPGVHIGLLADLARGAGGGRADRCSWSAPAR